MIEIRDTRFDGVVQPLDGFKFIRCTFTDCTLVYRGGALPVLEGNTITGCGFRFEGAANNTLAFLHTLYHSGGTEIVELIFKSIRQRTPEFKEDPLAE